MTARAQLLRSATVFAAVSAAWAVAVHNHYRELNPARPDTTKVMWEAGTSPIPDDFTVVKFPSADCQVTVSLLNNYSQPFQQAVLTSWRASTNGRFDVPFGKPDGTVNASDFTFNQKPSQRDACIRNGICRGGQQHSNTAVTFSSNFSTPASERVLIRTVQGTVTDEFLYDLQGEQVTPIRWTQDPKTSMAWERDNDATLQQFFATRWAVGQFALTFIALTGYMLLRARRPTDEPLATKHNQLAEHGCETQLEGDVAPRT